MRPVKSSMQIRSAELGLSSSTASWQIISSKNFPGDCRCTKLLLPRLWQQRNCKALLREDSEALLTFKQKIDSTERNKTRRNHPTIDRSTNPSENERYDKGSKPFLCTCQRIPQLSFRKIGILAPTTDLAWQPIDLVRPNYSARCRQT